MNSNAAAVGVFDHVQPALLLELPAPAARAVVLLPLDQIHRGSSGFHEDAESGHARALVAEMVRRYCLLGIDCSILEVQKLAWFIERGVKRLQVTDPLKFQFAANRYGPYSHNLEKLLDSLDGSYLRCDKRLSDADPLDLIWFNDAKTDLVAAYLNSGEGKTYAGVLEWASSTIDGFESPLGMELLATVDWLVEQDRVTPTVAAVMQGLRHWAGGETAGQRKLKIFNERLISIALEQLGEANRQVAALRAFRRW